MEAIDSTPDIQFDNLMSPANIANPFPLYAALREEDPVHLNRHFGTGQLSRYADVHMALGDQARFSSAISGPLRQKGAALPSASLDDFELGMRFFYEQVQGMDAPAHTVQRALISKAFAPRLMENLRTSIQHRVNRLLDNMEQSVECDFVSAFAYPLPSIVIFDLLGIPEEHYGHMRSSASSFARFPPAIFSANFNEVEAIAARLRNTEALLLRLIEQRRAEPRNDLLSALASVREGASSLSDAEIVVLCNFLLFAGHETTANLLAGAMLHLLANRSHWDLLLHRPEILPNAIEELLRYVSPVLTVSRVLKESVTLHGISMKSGERVQLLIGSANHDGAEFNSPENLNLERPKTHSVAFGHGAHYCIGAALARIEAQIALSSIQRRMPNVRLAAHEWEYQPIFFLRALKSLPISLRQ